MSCHQPYPQTLITLCTYAHAEAKYQVLMIISANFPQFNDDGFVTILPMQMLYNVGYLSYYTSSLFHGSSW